MSTSILAIFHNGLYSSWVCYLNSPEIKSRNFNAAVTITIIRGPVLSTKSVVFSVSLLTSSESRGALPCDPYSHLGPSKEPLAPTSPGLKISLPWYRKFISLVHIDHQSRLF